MELSGGTYERMVLHHKWESTRKREAFFIEFADLIAPALKKTRVYVTGGFRTVGAMVRALDTVDGVGLGRPLCQEPRLCADILAGRVQGAILQKLDLEDFAITNTAAGTHIRQIGKDEEPVDLSVGENVEAFMRDVGVWMGKLREDKEWKVFGYADLTGAVIVPYGAPRVAT